MRSTSTTHPPAAHPDRVHTPADVRRIWRVGLALVAPLPMLAKGVEYAFTPVDGGAPFLETVAAFQANLRLVSVLRWLDIAFGILLIPATVALIWAARRGAPRLTTAGALLTLPGFLTGFFMLGGGSLALATARHGLDVAAMAEAAAAFENDPSQLVAGLLFLVGIVVGLSLLGGALWRSHAAPRWMGVALILGAATHPFVPGHVAQGVGLLVAAVGFGGATYALLRTSNDEFDLPAVPRR